MSDRELTTERPVALSGLGSGDAGRERALLGGGPDGNEILTTANGGILIVLLAALGLTIVFKSRLLVEHLFIGLLLLGPVALKLASTGYRLVRYYTRDRDYLLRGPPVIALRLLGPLVVVLSLIVFATGVALLLTGPTGREPWLLLHKVSFLMWLAVMAAHVLAHLSELLRMLRLPVPALLLDLDRTLDVSERSERSTRRAPAQDWSPVPVAGGVGRALALSGAIVGGVVLAVALIPQYSAWTSSMALRVASH
jgi:hypothetical protein